MNIKSFNEYYKMLNEAANVEFEFELFKKIDVTNLLDVLLYFKKQITSVEDINGYDEDDDHSTPFIDASSVSSSMWKDMVYSVKNKSGEFDRARINLNTKIGEVHIDFRNYIKPDKKVFALVYYKNNSKEFVLSDEKDKLAFINFLNNKIEKDGGMNEALNDDNEITDEDDIFSNVPDYDLTLSLADSKGRIRYQA